MNKQSQIANRKSQIAIVGAGPAGSSLAIRLAKIGFEVSLIEREKFPRHKLCGEFISPECLEHFGELGVLDEMLAGGGERITETVFYAPGGRHVSVPSEWFGNAQEGALSLSRAEMDFRLLEKARAGGVKVLEETQTVGVLFERGEVYGVKVKSKNGETREIAADLTIDATGRANVLGKFLRKLQITNYKLQTEDQRPKTENRSSKLIGFKAHLENVNLEKGRCEIYFFRGGYGGLSHVEGNRANHCFLVKPDLVKKYIGQTNSLVEDVIFENRRARETMQDARPVFDWLAVSVDGFGLKDLNPAPRLFAVGDAAAFIDPFTGSGMLMALESAEILSKSIAENRFSPALTAENYNLNFQQRFQKRLRVCALMRRAAFVPNLAKTVIFALSLSRGVREILARATRGAGVIKKSNVKI
ncbi:MAG TPA: NAD(P)/FAD-dependent oxidoreductase [Pyrinomonadaceae bacterium]|jgi:flavin-dependent dehydrogenase